MSNSTATEGGSSTAELAAPAAAPVKIDPDAAYGIDALAAALGISRTTLWRWHRKGRNKFPRCYHVGVRPMWLGSAVIAWMQRRQQEALS